MKILRFLTVFICLSLGASVQAAQPVHTFRYFKSIPILDNGRLKPLDTYARNLLLQISARESYQGQPAIAWLAELLFTPEQTKDNKVFLINNPDLVTALNIEVDHSRRYSFAQLQKAYPKLLELYNAGVNVPEKQRDIVQAETLRVFENLRLYASLAHEMQFAVPDQDFTVNSSSNAQVLGVSQGEHSFLDIVLAAGPMQQAALKLEHKPQTAWDRTDKELMRLMDNLFEWSNLYRGMILAVVPSSQQPGLWISPWDAIRTAFQDNATRQTIMLWRDMTISYRAGQNDRFQAASRRYLDLMHGRFNAKKFHLEIAYEAWNPFLVAKIFYILALVFFVISFMSERRIYYHLAWASIIAGFVPHVLGLVSRIIIMSRPPVSNLYETFVFVSFITVLLGIIIECVNKRWLGLVVAGISGTSLLFIAGKYSMEGDTLKMLVAVLNSNFWLGTHVLTITMGYGATCVAGIVGHIWLVQKMLGKKADVLDSTHKILIGMLALALTLTFFGTNLGGIWADQSWGRFWGWDPKENGALMIVLWTAMLFHARIAGIIKQAGLAVGAVFGMVVVIWAWFGVNLLSIGLHSYGFTSGVAGPLAIYVFCEIMFLGVCIVFIRRSKS